VLGAAGLGCSLPADFGFLVALGSVVAVADPILWMFKGGNPSFPRCPRGWGAGSLRRGGDGGKRRTATSPACWDEPEQPHRASKRRWPEPCLPAPHPRSRPLAGGLAGRVQQPGRRGQASPTRCCSTGAGWLRDTAAAGGAEKQSVALF